MKKFIMNLKTRIKHTIIYVDTSTTENGLKRIVIARR